MIPEGINTISDIVVVVIALMWVMFRRIAEISGGVL